MTDSISDSESKASKTVVKYRRPLNNEQLAVLRLLYSYRFGIVSYVANYLDKTNTKVVQKKLKILEDQGLIAKRYDKTYKLLGKPAEYYLTPKGARLAKSLDDPKTNVSQRITDQGIKNLYKNSTVSLDFITHCLNILKVSLHLQTLYKDSIDTFTRTQLIPFDYFPTWRPDLYLSLRSGAKGKGKPQPYFLDIWDGTRPFFVSVRKARSYIKYSEEGDWPTNDNPPIILMLCDTKKNETKLRRQIRKALDESYEGMEFVTATIEAFMASDTPKAKVWRNSSEEDEPASLTSL